MNKIAVKKSDGTVAIIIPGDSASAESLLRDALRVELYVSHREIEDTDLPTDRVFRDAWTDDNPTSTVDINMSKAINIHKDHLRVLRKPRLEQVDIEFMRALELGADTSAIISHKQALRDVTNFPELPTPEELKAYIPEVLL